MGRGVFPFNLAGPSHKNSAPNLALHGSVNQPSSLLAPPNVDEPPKVDEGTVSKRTSQITYNSGFINRLTDPAPMIQAYQKSYNAATNYPLAKGWKPFKAELKGSKLYFYKPPSDRSAAIKELFPTGVIPPSLEDVIVADSEASEEVARSGRGREDGFGSVGRKKRAYWGRRTHPELVLSEGHIVKGTFEALVHEAVFATTFVHAADENSGFEEPSSDGRTPEWKDFSSAIILCLPYLVERSKFENEFTRLCSNLVRGANEDVREAERARVVWMAQEYVRYYCTPSDEPNWQEFTSSTIPNSNIMSLTINGGVPKSVSTQAIFTPSPNPNMACSQVNGASIVSPNLGTFSPRPQDGKMVSLMDALGTTGVPQAPGKPLNPRQQRPQVPFSDAVERPQKIWAMLSQDGFSREVLSLLDIQLIATSLQTFHRNVFQELPGNLTVDYVLGPDSPPPGASEDVDEAQTESTTRSATFFGSDEHPHWLTKLLLMQILGSDSSNTNNSHLDRSSRTHSRSEVISIWARVGELCRIAGDECSWKAILAALCSRPVSRLTKAWRRADRQSVIAVESWIYPENDGRVAAAREPMITAWGGDSKERLRYELERARNEVDEHWATEPFLKAKDIFEGLRTHFALCSRMPVDTASLSQDVTKLVSLWGDLFEGKERAQCIRCEIPAVRPTSLGDRRFIDSDASVEQFMSLSLAAEPRRKGLFEPLFWSQTSVIPHTHCNPLVPLLFVEPMPTVSLLDRSQVWRGRLESGPTKLSVEELQQLRNLDSSLRPFGQNDASASKEKLLKIGDVDLRGTAIPVYDGELLLVARPDKDPGSASRPASRAPSRPPSSAIETSGGDRTIVRTPSIRVKPSSSQGLERKSSVQRRNSLPAISQRPSPPVVTEVSTERPIRVLVQAGTLDRLVNVLIHGLKGVSVAVADDNGETSLRDGNTRDLIVDHSEFARVWWNVFRSFVTPIVFFELLRKRFVGSRPSTTTSTNAPVHVVQYRSEIFGAVREWITAGGGAQDCLDDAQLYELVRAFLEAPLDRSVPDCSPADDDAELDQAWDGLDMTRKDTLSTFISHTLRPPALCVAVLRSSTIVSQNRNFGNQAPDLDRVTAEDLVENLDAMGFAAFSNVTEEDLFITADLLEVQSADRTGWFCTREAHLLDDVEIQTMYSHLMEVEPSSMITDSQDSVYRLLPPSVRSCVRAYNILRKWIISKLVGPKLGIRGRQARTDLCLRAIEIARMRSLEGSSGFVDPHERPVVRSFVEAVLTAAIISPESRMHQRPWQNVAAVRGAQCDSLGALLSRPMVSSKLYGDPLVVDISWLLERMLEIVSVPNTVALSLEDPQSIINLDKRRHLCDIILNTPTLLSKHGRSRDDVDRRDFERLNNIEKEVNAIHFDLRGIKEEGQREALQAQTSGSASAKKVIRPFQRLVSLQHEKSKRDKYLYDRLSKDKKQEQLRMERRDEYLNKVMRPRKPMTQAQKQHRLKKSYSSAFFQLMRPISSAFTDHALVAKKSPAELDFAASGKPSLVLSIVGAKVAQFINNERSYMFQLDTEEGEQYLLQAFSRQEMTRWIETITNVSKVAAKRRLTYLGNSPKPQLSDHIIDPVGVPSASRDPTAVFGVELEFLLEREAGGADVPHGTIPSVIASCLEEVEARGLSEVGIYRIAGAALEINALRDAFNRGEMPITESTDVYAIGDLIKSWFRVLPEPVFPSSAYYAIIEAIKVENLHARLLSIRGVIHALPRAHFDLLKRVAEHLDKVTDFEEQNHMTAEALAIVFSPNLLRAPQNDFALILSNMGYTHKLVKALITHFHVIFDEDYEAENDAEEEMEAPILEEEEEEDIPPSRSTHTGDEE
ncbi:rho GTPase activating protein 22 [Chiua virens]|nr:rho GTPase activating protein 22 [Chiua virens]